MAWTVNKNGVRPKVQLTAAEQTALNDFMGGVQKGNHPKDAAKSSMQYKKLTANQYQIRLSQGNRATFTVDEKAEVVKFLQVGGHT